MGKVDFGAYRTQEAGFPRNLVLWTGNDGFSYMDKWAAAEIMEGLASNLHSCFADVQYW